MRRLDVLLVLKALNDASMAGGAPASHHQQDAVAHSPHIQAGVHLVFSLSQELVCRPRSFQAVSTPGKGEEGGCILIWLKAALPRSAFFHKRPSKETSRLPRWMS